MDKKALVKLLTECLNEINNLMVKIDAGEKQGWEGVRRRTVLCAKIKEQARLLSYDVT